MRVLLRSNTLNGILKLSNSTFVNTRQSHQKKRVHLMDPRILELTNFWFCNRAYQSITQNLNLCQGINFRSGPELCLVLQVPWLCSKPVAAARAPEAIPLYEYLANLASLLTAGIPARANWLLGLVTDAYSFTSHFFITGNNLLKRMPRPRQSASSLTCTYYV